jgi:hypothetical protein
MLPQLAMKKRKLSCVHHLIFWEKCNQHKIPEIVKTPRE